MIDPETLSEGQVRLPYFYVHGPADQRRAVLCPGCAVDAPDPEKLVAVYTAHRLYVCGGCGVYIGPANAEEEEQA